MEKQQIEEFLNQLTHQQKVNLGFRLMDYLSEQVHVDGNTITIVTNEYQTDED